MQYTPIRNYTSGGKKKPTIPIWPCLLAMFEEVLCKFKKKRCNIGIFITMNKKVCN